MNIRKFIQKLGRVSFRDFMEHALYCPEDGYYGAGKVKIGGVDMDYITHPELTSPYFGRGIVRQINQMWGLMGRPAKFDLVEIGAGNGILARDILNEAKQLYPNLYQAVKFMIIEISPALIKRQKKLISGKYQRKIKWWQGSAVNYNQKIEGVIISNELFDSLPVDRVVFRDNKFYQVCVCYQKGQYQEELSQISAGEIFKYLTSLGMKFFSGQHLCINLDSVRLLGQMAKNLERGYIITIDYGDEAEKLYGNDLSYIKVGKKRQVGTYPYRDISEADITSNVDFTSLIKTGRGLGLADLLYISEQEFFKYWLALDLKKEKGIEDPFGHFIGSGYKVLIQGRAVPRIDLKKA